MWLCIVQQAITIVMRIDFFRTQCWIVDHFLLLLISLKVFVWFNLCCTFYLAPIDNQLHFSQDDAFQESRYCYQQAKQILLSWLPTIDKHLVDLKYP